MRLFHFYVCVYVYVYKFLWHHVSIISVLMKHTFYDHNNNNAFNKTSKRLKTYQQQQHQPGSISIERVRLNQLRCMLASFSHFFEELL